MKHKDIENRIIAALSQRIEAPNPHVLDAAKAELRQTKQKRMDLANWVWATTVVVLLCLAVVLPLTLNGQHSPDEIEETRYSIIDSMQSYLDKSEIPLITLQNMPFTQPEIGGSNNTHDCDYAVKLSTVVYQNEQPIYLEERYLYKNTDAIVCDVLLCAETGPLYFAEYLVLENEFSEPYLCPFRYNYDAKTGRGYAITQSHGYTVCFSISSQTEDLFLSHLKNFAISQKD